MARSPGVHVLLLSLVVGGCTTARPDPSLLDKPPEAFTMPRVQAEEPPAKEPPRERPWVKYVTQPLGFTAEVAGVIAFGILQVVCTPGFHYP
jgi:hypothetical protein